MSTALKSLAQRLITYAFILAPVAIGAYAAVGIGAGFGSQAIEHGWEAFAAAHHCVQVQAPIDIEQPTAFTCDALPDHVDALARIGIRVQR